MLQKNHGNRSPSLHECQCLELWNSEKSERKRFHTLHFGCFEYRTLVQNHSLCESTQYLQGSCQFGLRENDREPTIFAVKGTNTEILKSVDA